MSRLPVPNSDNGQWGTILNDFLRQSHQDDGTLKNGIVTLSTIATNTVVDLSTDQTVAGVKTFTSSPIVPTPTTGTQAANKDYVDGFGSALVPGNTTGADPGTAVAIDSVMGTAGQTVANTDGAIAIGYDGTNAASATGSNSVAIGADSVADGNFVVALGSTASATGDSSTAIGWGAEASGEGSVALGGGTYSESGTMGAYADGYNALAVGSSSATGDQSVALGSSTANGFQATAIGFNASAQYDESVSMGSDTSVSSYGAVAVGFTAYIDDSSEGSTALGVNPHVYNSVNAVAINGNVDSGNSGIAINAVVNSGNGAVAIGTDSDGNVAQANNDNDFILGTSEHNVQLAGTLEVGSGLAAQGSVDLGSGDTQINGTLIVPQTAPSTPVDGQIWITSSGLYFQANGTTHGPLT